MSIFDQKNLTLYQRFLILIFTCISMMLGAQTKVDTLFDSYTKRIVSITVAKNNHKTVLTYNNYDPQFVISKNDYLNDKLENWSFEYSANYVVSKQTTYKNGKRNGKETIYKSGIISSEIEYKNDTLHGKSVKYYPSGAKQSIETFKNGQKMGESFHYYKSSFLANHQFWDTVRNYNNYSKKWETKSVNTGKSETFFESGKPNQLAHYVKGNKHGECKDWYENGKLKALTNFKNNMQFGKQVFYFQNGNIEKEHNVYHMYDSAMKYTIKYEGKYLEYFENKKPRTIGNYKKFKKHGKWQEYYGDFLYLDSEYKNGLLVNKFVNYHRNSTKIEQTAFYKISKLNAKDTSVIEGERLFYYENGKARNKEVYENGLCIKNVSFYDSGIMAQEEFVKDSLVYQTRYYKNGNKELEQVARYNPKKNILQQEFEVTKVYHENGATKAINSTKLFPLSIKQEFNDSGKVIHKSIQIANNSFIESNFYPTGAFKNDVFKFYHPHSYYNINRQNVEFFENGLPKSFGVYGIYRVTWLSNGDVLKTETFTTYNENLPKDTILNLDSLRIIHNALKSNTKRSILEDLSDGVKTSYYAEGKPYLQTEMKNGNICNFFKAFYYNGNKMLDLKLDKDNKPDGEYYSYYEDGRLYEQGNFLHGTACGKWISFTMFGDTVKAFELKEPSNETWNNAHYKYYKEFYASVYQKGSKPKTHIVNDVDPLKRISISYHPTGAIAEEKYYDEKTKSNIVRGSYSNGNKGRFESTDINGKKNGYYFQARENGVPYYEMNYKKDSLDGPYKGYWESGKVRFDGSYAMGKRIGTWNTYDNDGKKIKTEQFDKDVLKSDTIPNLCNCPIAKKENGFTPLVSQLLNTSKASIWQFGFHTPITKYLDNLFYSSYNPSYDKNYKYTSLNIISYDEIVTKLPNENGIELVLNPCVNIQKPSLINISVSLTEKDPNSLRVTLYPDDNIAFRFDTSLMKPINKLFNKTEASFKVKSLEYTMEGLVMKQTSSPCFTPSLIVNTNAQLNLFEFYPGTNLDDIGTVVFNTNALFSFIKKDMLKQAGISNANGTLTDKSNGALQYNVRNVILVNKVILGEILFEKSPSNKGEFIFNDKSYTEVEIKQQLNKLFNNKAKIITEINLDKLVVSFLINAGK